MKQEPESSLMETLRRASIDVNRWPAWKTGSTEAERQARRDALERQEGRAIYSKVRCPCCGNLLTLDEVAALRERLAAAEAP